MNINLFSQILTKVTSVLDTLGLVLVILLPSLFIVIPLTVFLVSKVKDSYYIKKNKIKHKNYLDF